MTFKTGSVKCLAYSLCFYCGVASASPEVALGQHWKVAVEVKSPIGGEIHAIAETGGYEISFNPVLIFQLRPIDLHSPDLVVPVIIRDNSLSLADYPTFALLDSEGKRIPIYVSSSHSWEDLKLHIGSRAKLSFCFPGALVWRTKVIGSYRLQVTGRIADESGSTYEYYAEAPLSLGNQN